MSLPLENDRLCFCCGQDNELGLKLAISYPSRGVAETRLVVPQHMAGWRGIAHGGLLSMVLDEMMAHACISAGARAVTAEMTTRFQKAVLVGSEIRVEGHVSGERGRVLSTEGRVYDAEGAVVAQSTATFVKVPVDEGKRIE